MFSIWNWVFYPFVCLFLHFKPNVCIVIACPCGHLYYIWMSHSRWLISNLKGFFCMFHCWVCCTTGCTNCKCQRSRRKKRCNSRGARCDDVITHGRGRLGPPHTVIFRLGTVTVIHTCDTVFREDTHILLFLCLYGLAGCFPTVWKAHAHLQCLSWDQDVTLLCFRCNLLGMVQF